MKNTGGQVFEARIAEFKGGKLQRLDIKNEQDATAIKQMLEASTLNVTRVESKPTKRNPSAPFTTSTLQQDASRQLGFSASRIMQIAQRLYEGIDIGGETVGLITYMRTDGVQIAPEAIPSVRAQIESDFGNKYVPEKPRIYTSKAKNAQEAHEAIRPTEIDRTPAKMAKFLDDEQRKLYDLIWKRTISSQMESAEIERTSVDITATHNGEEAILRANGSVIRFDGFLAAYMSENDDDEADAKLLPALSQGEKVGSEKIESKQHFTEPPPRYSEASLIKKMEELGIGRPSTYASVLATLQNRDYVILEKRRFTPDSKGRVVTSFLESFFKRYVEYDFTADLEERLDKISAGELKWKDLLRDFWKQFSGSIDEIKDLRVSEVLDMLNLELAPLAFPPREDGSHPRSCPKCDNGELSLKVGRYGAFVGCSNYPECNFTRQLGAAEGDDAANDGPKVLGNDPETEEEITLRTGRFGPYVQRGEGKEAKRGSIPKGWNPSEIDFERAMQLLSLPRDVGLHPESGKMITAGNGRYGPFVLHEGVYGSLDSPDEVFTVGINRAVDLIAEKIAKGGARRGAAAALKELGEHPTHGGMVAVKSGRYGPYVNHGKVNATLRKDKDPLEVTMEEAVAMIEAKGGSKPAGKKAAAKKTPAKKKAAPKKTAAKKKAAPKKATATEKEA